MEKLAQKNLETCNDNDLYLQETLEKLANDSMYLNELSREQIKLIGQNILYDELKEKMMIELEYKRYNDDDINEFIERFDSFYTKKEYNACLKKLVVWRFALKNDEADLFVHHLINQGLPNLTVLHTIKICSSFYNWRIERKNSKFKNPFGKTSFKPKKVNKKDIYIPT